LHKSGCKSESKESYFFASELGPLVIVESEVKVSQITGFKEVDKPVTDIAQILDKKHFYVEITRQIQEIVSVGKVPINLFREIADRVLVGNVSDHNRGARVVADDILPDLEHIVVKRLRTLLVLVLVETVLVLH
jgi:hypothetical protein